MENKRSSAADYPKASQQILRLFKPPATTLPYVDRYLVTVVWVKVVPFPPEYIMFLDFSTLI
jgi:hypothetical protein